jgi:hypothetical protein
LHGFVVSSGDGSSRHLFTAKGEGFGIKD